MKLKLRKAARFLASIYDGVGTTVRRDGLATYVDLDYTKFAALGSFTPSQKQVAIQDTITGLWNTVTLAYLVQGASPYVLQEVTSASSAIAADTTILVINRNNPATTNLTLPSIADRGGKPLMIVDYSTSVSSHDIAIAPASGSENIMRQSTWHISSNAASLGSVTLFPVIDYNAWMIAP